MHLSLLVQLKHRFANFLLNKRIFNAGNLSSPLDLDKAKTIGIVYTVNNSEERDFVKNFTKELKDLNKTVYQLEYFDAVENPDNLLQTKDYIFLTQNDLSFFDLPKKSAMEDFIGQEFDIIMGFCFQNCFPVHYILAISKADFKIGLYDENYSYIYDFMISAEPKSGMKQVLDTVKYYLNSIHKN